MLTAEFTEEELAVIVKILLYNYNELIRHGELFKLNEDECDLFVNIITRWKEGAESLRREQ